MDEAGKYGNTLHFEGEPMPEKAFDSFITGIRDSLREKLPDNMVGLLKPSLRDTTVDIEPDDDIEFKEKFKSYLLGVKPGNITFIRNVDADS